MRIDNFSTIPLAAFEHLVSFASRGLSCIGMARLSVYGLDMPGVCTEGIAYRFDPAIGLRPCPIPSRVVVALSTGQVYPARSTAVAEVGEITFNSWEEEVVFVLAHEFKHVQQFWTWSNRDLLRKAEMEIDAELHAVKVLESWRAAQAELSKAA